MQITKMKNLSLKCDWSLTCLNGNLNLVFKIRLSPSRKICFICFIECPLKMIKNAFYFILKAFFFPSSRKKKPEKKEKET